MRSFGGVAGIARIGNLWFEQALARADGMVHQARSTSRSPWSPAAISLAAQTDDLVVCFELAGAWTAPFMTGWCWSEDQVGIVAPKPKLLDRRRGGAVFGGTSNWLSVRKRCNGRGRHCVDQVAVERHGRQRLGGAIACVSFKEAWRGLLR